MATKGTQVERRIQKPGDPEARARTYGSPRLFRHYSAWTAAIVEKADIAFTDIKEKSGRIVAVLGGHSDVDVHAHCDPDGAVSLTAVTISGFRMVRVPRVWDSSERREAERAPRDELGRLARSFRTALDEWTKRIPVLATWIRYSPPPPGAKPVEPWFDDQSDDEDDGGPETMH